MPKDSDLETLKTQILAVYYTTIFSNVSSSTQRNINEFGTISDNEKVYRFEKAYFKKVVHHLSFTSADTEAQGSQHRLILNIQVRV